MNRSLVSHHRLHVLTQLYFSFMACYACVLPRCQVHLPHDFAAGFFFPLEPNMSLSSFSAKPTRFL